MALRESRFHWKVRLLVGVAVGGVVGLLYLAGRKCCQGLMMNSPATGNLGAENFWRSTLTPLK